LLELEQQLSKSQGLKNQQGQNTEYRFHQLLEQELK